MYQPYPSSRQPAEPPRPPAPAPVLTAVKLMYAGAAASTVTLIIAVTVDAATDRHLQDAGQPRRSRHGGARPDPPRAGLADRPGRGVAAVAPGLQRVLQAAGLHPGQAQRTVVCPDGIIQLTPA